MKKYLILAAAAAVTLASCAKVETYKVSENDGEMPIAFSNYAPKSLVKAGDTYVASTALVDGKHFAVYAWATAFGSFLTANPGDPAFMNPADVTYNSDNTTGEGNTYTPVRYWPSGDEPDNLSFAAYYPYGGAGITAPTFDANTVGVYDFEAQSAPANMVDFCVADVVNDQVYGSTNATAAGYKQTVKFTFKHQLTKVQFKFKKASGIDAGTTIKLVDAKLVNIKTTGTLTATYTRNATPAVNAAGTTATAWSAQAIAGTPIVYDVTLNGSNPETGSEITLTEDLSAVAKGDIFLMVPQTMIAKDGTNPQYLEVTWQVITNGETTTNTKKLYLDECVNAQGGSTQADIDWDMNDFVTYNITIGPKPIWFTATVTGWDDEQNAYFDVQ